MSETFKYYAGFKPCGCLVAVCVDKPEHKDDTADFAKECIKDGLRLEHLTCPPRPALQTCKCGKTVDMFSNDKAGA